ncbi:MAG TPA: ABC transporter substrate-binding protein [Anaerolineae bacterium]|nr:ABC transporter substrate-binding protein [Anaerolineae bacterium]
MSRRAGRLLLLLGSCLFLLASCAFPGTVPETVKLGLSAPFEGLYRDLGYEALYAARLAVRQVNQAGGIGGGYLVELVALNDMNDAQEAAAQAVEMAVDVGILGVIGGLSPRTATASAPEYATRGLALVTPFAAPRYLGELEANLAAGVLGAHTAAILHGADAADLALAEGFSDAFAAQGGEVLLSACYASDDDAANLLVELAEEPDLLFVAAETSRAAAWIVALRAGGFGGTIFGGPEAASALLVKLAGAASEGVYAASPFGSGAMDSDFRSAYEALSGGVAPRGVAAWTYAAAQDLLGVMSSALEGGTDSARQRTEEALKHRSADGSMALYVVRGGQFLPATEGE